MELKINKRLKEFGIKNVAIYKVVPGHIFWVVGVFFDDNFIMECGDEEKIDTYEAVGKYLFRCVEVHKKAMQERGHYENR